MNSARRQVATLRLLSACVGLTVLLSCGPRTPENAAGRRAGAGGPGAATQTGATAAPEKVRFIPARFLAGDEVEALVPLGQAGERLGVGFELKSGAGLASSGPSADPVLRSLSVAKGSAGWEARIVFVPWSPGPGHLPSITARGIAIPAVSYNVSSSLGEEDRDLAPARPQREPPGTALYLYGLAGLLLALVLGALGSAAYLVPAAHSMLARRRAAQAYRRLRRGVAYLRRGLELAAPELFYAALARELRIYLAARVEASIPNLSSRELAASPEALFPAPGIRESAAALIGEAERGRYSGELVPGDATAEILREAADRVLALGVAAEEAINARL